MGGGLTLLHASHFSLPTDGSIPSIPSRRWRSPIAELASSHPESREHVAPGGLHSPVRRVQRLVAQPRRSRRGVPGLLRGVLCPDRAGVHYFLRGFRIVLYE